MTQLVGEVIQIIGPVVDISFEQAGNNMPDIHDALEITREDGRLLLWNASSISVKIPSAAIAMDSTDGLQPGHEGHCYGRSHFDAGWRTDQGQAAECDR